MMIVQERQALPSVVAFGGMREQFQWVLDTQVKIVELEVMCLQLLRVEIGVLRLGSALQ